MSTTYSPAGRFVETQVQAHLLNQVQDASEAIRKLSADVERVAKDTVARLDAGYGVNSCGVLQSAGRDLDTMCGLRGAMATAARHAGCTTEQIELAGTGRGTYFMPAPDGVAVGRSESEACEAGTVGCSVHHTGDESCQPW